MAYTVTIKPGLKDVVLPNGRRCQGDDTIVLSDEHYGLMPQSARDTVLASADVVPVPAS
jgi:hypothetical protein